MPEDLSSGFLEGWTVFSLKLYRRKKTNTDALQLGAQIFVCKLIPSKRRENPTSQHDVTIQRSPDVNLRVLIFYTWSVLSFFCYINQFLENGRKPCIFGRRLTYYARDFKFQSFDQRVKIVRLLMVEIGSWVHWMWPENYLHSLLIFLTLLSVCTALVSLSCKYMYHGKRR